MAALHEFTLATKLDPGDADSHFELGKVAWALSARPDLTQPGASRLSASDYQSLAIAEVGKAAALRPQSVEFRLTLAELYLDAGRAQDSLLEAQEALRLSPQDPAAHLTLGRAHFATGEEDKAGSEFRAALELDPARGEAHLALGYLRQFQRKLSEAQEEFRQAIRLSPNSAAGHSALAGLLLDAGQPAEARKLLEKAVALDPGDWRSQYRLAGLLMEAGEAGRATQLVESVARLRPDFLPAQEQLGLGYLRRGDLKRAAEQAEALSAANPRAAEGHRLAAFIEWKKRNVEASLAECAMALESDPGSAQMLALQALELWLLGRKKEAQQALSQAAKVEPKLATAEVFCRLLLCGAKDIGIVDEFLRKNRWALSSPSSP